MVKGARKAGLKLPLLLMGYYNPMFIYGEERLIRNCKEAGVNGFIICDLPPEESVIFRRACSKDGYTFDYFVSMDSVLLIILNRLSYIPLIAPSTSNDRMRLLCGIADSFIYVVSRMGVTGASGTINVSLPDICKSVHGYAGNTPIAVGFGVSTREHFVNVGKVAEGVVIGSQIVTVLAKAPEGVQAKREAVKLYCAGIVAREATPHKVVVEEAADKDGTVDTLSHPDEKTKVQNGSSQFDDLNIEFGKVHPEVCNLLQTSSRRRCTDIIALQAFSFPLW